LVKRRGLAKEMCDRGAVKINGKPAKPSKEVSEGDIIEIETPLRYVKAQVLKLPKGKNVSKREARELIKVIEERKKDVREILDLL